MRIFLGGADWVPATEPQAQHEMFKLAKPTDLSTRGLDLCCKRLSRSQQHCSRNSYFSTLCIFLVSTDVAQQLMCRNIYYPSSFIVPASSCLVTTLLSTAEVFETSQRLTAACTCQLSNLSLFWHTLRETSCGHLDKYNSFYASGKMGVFPGPAVGNEGCMGFSSRREVYL